MYMFNFIMFPIFFLSIIFSLSSNSWIMIWIGMELNMMSFIFLMFKTNINMMMMESIMKYFLIQSMGSLLFLITINSNMIFYSEKSNIWSMAPPIALMLKSGTAPLHFWTPSVVMKFSFTSFFLFLSFQKLVPLLIMFTSWFWIIPMSCLINIFIGSMGGINQSAMFKMLLFSSINNIGWMMLSMMKSFNLFLFFFINYTILSLLIMKFMQLNQIKWMIQIKSYKNSIKMFFMSMMMSMSGYPPFLGFVPKWLTIKYLYFNYPLTITSSIIFSIYTLYFYLKSTTVLMTKSLSMKKWEGKNTINLYLPVLINTTGPFMLYFIN